MRHFARAVKGVDLKSTAETRVGSSPAGDEILFWDDGMRRRHRTILNPHAVCGIMHAAQDYLKIACFIMCGFLLYDGVMFRVTSELPIAIKATT